MKTPQELGREYETQIAKEFGLKPVIASGALWFSKLDVRGLATRWSCKYTSKNSYAISKKDIDEAIRACQGPGGDNSIPIWALKIDEPRYEVVIMLKEDFKQFLEEPSYIGIQTDISEKRKRASVPGLLRGNNERSND